MPPIPPPSTFPAHPRIILYQQTHHHLERPISLLPLLTAQPSSSPAITHLIVAAVHINATGSSSALSLNDHAPSDPRFTQLWDEVLVLQDSGVKVMCMLGGAAQGSFARLDYHPAELAALPALPANGGRLPSPARFEEHYVTLRDFIRERRLDGIDLDVEEPTSLAGMLHLIDRLRADFGPAPGFAISLAPVATALVRGLPHLSGFDYFELERLRGADVDWYNAQFYNGWGGLDAEFPDPDARGWRSGWYDQIVGQEGWRPDRVVLGLLTNPRHGGSGYVGWETVAARLADLVDRYPGFGGVMGWEYWGAVPELDVPGVAGEGRGEAGEEENHYWRWAWRMRWIFALREIRDRAIVVAAGRSLARLSIPVDAEGGHFPLSSPGPGRD